MASRKLISTWITVAIVTSLFAHLDGGWLASWTALAPHLIVRGQVWRLVTWAIVTPDPLDLILTCVSVYRLGGELVVRWGERRLRAFMLQIVVAAAIATLAIGLVSDHVWYLERMGGWAVSDALVIAWARQYPERVLHLYGLLAVNGRQLIGATIAITCVYAIFGGVLAWLPELAVCAAVYWYPSAWLSPRGWN